MTEDIKKLEDILIPPKAGEVRKSDLMDVPSLTGCVLPKYPDGGLVILNMPNGESFISVYTDEEKLRASMKEVKILPYSISIIDDGKLFVEDIKALGIRIMLDPHAVQNDAGKWVTRWTEIVS